MATHVQDFWTSRNKLVDGETRVGKPGRLWFDPDTYTIRVGNGTPGGAIITSATFIALHDSPDAYSGMADSIVKVNQTSDGLMFSNIVDGGNF